MKLLFLHLDDIKESGKRLHEARVEHAHIRVCGPWASCCLLLSIFFLFCKTKMGLPDSKVCSENQKHDDNTQPGRVHCAL